MLRKPTSSMYLTPSLRRSLDLDARHIAKWAVKQSSSVRWLVSELISAADPVHWATFASGSVFEGASLRGFPPRPCYAIS